MDLVLGANPRPDRDRWPWAVLRAPTTLMTDPQVFAADQWCYERLGDASGAWHGLHTGWMFADHDLALEFYLTWG